MNCCSYSTNALQIQTEVTAYFSSSQLLLFGVTNNLTMLTITLHFDPSADTLY